MAEAEETEEKPEKAPAEETPPEEAAPEEASEEESESKPGEEAKAKEEKPEKEPEPEEESPRANLLLFGRWDISAVEVRDPGLARYMNLSPTYLPHTGGRLSNRPFSKGRVNLVERLTNGMMRTEKYTGKKGKTIQVVKEAFEILEKRAKKNPIQLLVDALENSAPREEITRLRFGGISVPRAVDIAPSRRLDLAMRHLCRGAVTSTYKNPKPVAQCLAEEVLAAAQGDMNSYAIGKKEEMERVAGSAR